MVLVAFSTDDGFNLTRNHFGDGKEFYIYEITQEGAKLVKVIKNTAPEEDLHGDPKKASAIGQLLGKEGVQVLVGFAMGPNIVRMRKRFVPVISRCSSIEDAIKGIIDKYTEIEKETQKEGDKEVIFVCQ